jgi:hypothetical protein
MDTKALVIVQSSLVVTYTLSRTMSASLNVWYQHVHPKRRALQPKSATTNLRPPTAAQEEVAPRLKP